MVRDWYIKKGWHKMTYLATCPQLEIYSSQDLLLTYCVNSKKKKICDRNGDWAVLLFNRLNSTIDITLDFADKKTSEKLTELFAAMSSGGVDAERVDELRKAYKA